MASNARDQPNEANDVPNVIYIQEKTLLCRWDKRKGTSRCFTDTADDLSTSSLPSEQDPIEARTSSSSAPPKAPRRSVSPSRRGIHNRAERHRDASKQSGVDIGAIPLRHVSFNSANGVPLIMECAAPTLLGNLPNDRVTAVFCIRREGCGSCRDHGRQLTQLSQQFPRLNLFGIVKKSSLHNDPALCEFYKDYFTFPIYRDDQWDTFKFLGNRKVSVWKTLKLSRKVLARWKDQNIPNAYVGGDHFTQGGILLFDTKGQLRYVYYERYGDQLDLEALRWAIQNCAAEREAAPVVLKMEATAPPRRPGRSKRDVAARRPTRQEFKITGEVYV